MAIRKVILANGKEDDRGRLGQAAAPARDPRRRRLHGDARSSSRTCCYGTGTRANFGRPAAGKTGTTDDHADAWFCGYLPNLEATVWVGYPQGEIPMENVHGIAVAGGSFPAEIWRLFMERAVRYSPPQDFALPKTYPVWKPFKRGHYAIQYVPTDTTSSTTTAKTTTRPATTAAETTTEQQVPVPLEPTTEQVTTEAPPPVTTDASLPPPPPVTTAPPVTTEPGGRPRSARRRPSLRACALHGSRCA